MQCNCFSEMQKKLTEFVTKQLGVPALVEMHGTVMVLEPKFDTLPGVKYTVTADKPGYKKGKEQTLICRYCPICGQPAKADSKTAEAAS